MRLITLLGTAAVLITGCGRSTPEDACVDLVETIADKAEECGLDYQASYQAAVEVFADGDCQKARRARDERELYDECLPAVEAISCEKLRMSGIDFPESCFLDPGQSDP